MNFWKSKLYYLYLYPNYYTPMGYIYKTNHEYLDNIDTEAKAYFLGLMYADGCVSPKNGNRQHRMTISITAEDGYIFEHFSDLTSKKADFKNSPSIVKAGCKPQYQFRVTSNKIGEKLIEFGCYSNKSRIGMKFPELPEEMYKHFIRGFLDGDGCITIKKINYKYKRKTEGLRKDTHQQRYKLKIAFCSTDKVFLEELAKKLELTKVYFVKKMRKQYTYVLWIERESETQKVLEYLYRDATVYFKRKFNKVIEYNTTIKSQANGTPFEGLTTT